VRGKFKASQLLPYRVPRCRQGSRAYELSGASCGQTCAGLGRLRQQNHRHCGEIRVEGRQSASDQIRVDEMDHAGSVGQKIACKRRLSGAIWPSDNNAKRLSSFSLGHPDCPKRAGWWPGAESDFSRKVLIRKIIFGATHRYLPRSARPRAPFIFVPLERCAPSPRLGESRHVRHEPPSTADSL
jgi:hypothetical protein